MVENTIAPLGGEQVSWANMARKAQNAAKKNLNMMRETLGMANTLKKRFRNVNGNVNGNVNRGEPLPKRVPPGGNYGGGAYTSQKSRKSKAIKKRSHKTRRNRKLKSRYTKKSKHVR